MIGGQTKTPTISVRYTDKKNYVGGAGIVSKHLAVAGAKVNFISVLGDDNLKEYVKKEPGLKALERTIIYMSKWGEEHNQAWQTYFVNVSPSRAVYDIRSGKVSPWVLYLSDTGGTLLERFNDEQVKMIQDNIDPPFWMKLFKKNKDEVAEIKQTCEEANL